MASELLNKYGNAVSSLELIPSGGGVYEVTKNEILLFSKKSKGLINMEMQFPHLH